MNKYIVTTTIQEPTEATIKFSKKKDWTLVVVGDKKTPASEYKKINCIYLTPQEQEKINKELSDEIGWNSIQRRNMGFLFAYKEGADVVASVDDDNIPYKDWGKDLYIGQEINIDAYHSSNGIFDPLSVTEHDDLWHRGYPIDLLLSKNKIKKLGKRKFNVLIQADFWNGDPDIDAICRLSKKPEVKFSFKKPFGSYQVSPFNSQNTFFHRDVIPYYMVLPHVGRMDDIWGGYILQKKFPRSLIYNRASVYQKRNIQDLVLNLEKEIIGYRNTYNFLKSEYNLPDQVSKAYNKYLKAF